MIPYRSPEHTRGTGDCRACNNSRLPDCISCRGKATVHRILATGEPYCEKCGPGVNGPQNQPEITASRRPTYREHKRREAGSR